MNHPELNEVVRGAQPRFAWCCGVLNRGVECGKHDLSLNRISPFRPDNTIDRDAMDRVLSDWRGVI